MTSKEKLHEQELKRPDPLQVKLARILDSILSNGKIIAGIAVAGCLVVGGYYVYEQITTNIREGRVEELSKIQIVYAGEEKQAADKRQEIQKKIDALTPPPKSPEGQATPPATEPLKPEVEAQKKELTKQMEAIKADHGISQGQFQGFAKKYETQPEGWAAAMILGKLLVDGEKYSEAKNVYETLLTQTKQEPFYQIQTVFGLVGVYEELGEFDKGLAEVDKLINLMAGSKDTSTTTQALFSGYKSDLMPKLLLSKAQLLVFKGNKDEARKTLAELIEQHGTAAAAQKARTMRSLIN